MFLDQAEGAEEEVAKEQDGADEVQEEGGPEAGIQVGHDGQYYYDSGQWETVFDDDVIEFHLCDAFIFGPVCGW